MIDLSPISISVINNQIARQVQLCSYALHFLVKLVAEHYDRVIAANASTAQLKCAMQHLRVIHTPRTKS